MHVDPVGVLDAVRTLTSEGRYPQALERQVWFHDHALEYDLSLSAVRLSFGLGTWMDLAAPAREAMVAARDRAAAAVLGGDPTFDRFQELAAINERLGEEAETGAVFLTLREANPRLARQVYVLAEPGLVFRREFEVCGAYLTDAADRFEVIRGRRWSVLAQISATEDGHAAPLADLMEARFTGEVVQVVEILNAVGRVTEAEQIRRWALAETGSATARATITAAGASSVSS